MILYPAIDLKDGQCVRLLQGDMDKATVFNNSPAEQAKAFWDAGCEWLHIVDLNGAFAGKPVNGNAVEDILRTCKIPIQLGGGIRDMKTIEYWLDKGIARVILGTVAAENPELVREAAKAFPNQIAVGIDAIDNKVAIQGWAEYGQIKPLDLAVRYEDAGIAALIFTDISKDGLMQGPNISATVAITDAVKIPVIASGGVSSLWDLRRLQNSYKLDTPDELQLIKLELYDTPPLNGIIVGRALYDKKIDIKEALALLKNS